MACLSYARYCIYWSRGVMPQQGVGCSRGMCWGIGHACGTESALVPCAFVREGSETCPDLRWSRRAGEGNRTLMTSLEGVPPMAVAGAGLRVRVPGGDRD